MSFIIHNWGLHVGNVEITGITSSSVFLIGDNRQIRLNSYFDTPPESFIVGGFVPLSAGGGAGDAARGGAKDD
ncbi:spore gernimation protein GerPD [Thalassobacillus pellis]|uniref:spore gernimation protein GerPD n=1 Tax=Thalassobacillus pellis TaxID=748008 RepID=UPI00195F3355|nr:spore gernimation protein GerPD [Thalassobacillus pellis]MBM7554093.1 spore germination protein PD [Thalassobacillus pellis]